MILGFKTKNEREIDRLNEIIDTLIVNDTKVSGENDKLKNESDELKKQIKQFKEENLKSFNVIKDLTLKLEKKEQSRHKTAAILGGTKKQKNILQQQLEYSNTIINQLYQVMEKREKDYLFVLRLLFNEIKFEKHTRDFLRQKLKEFKTKYPNELSLERKDKDVSNSTK